MQTWGRDVNKREELEILFLIYQVLITSTTIITFEKNCSAWWVYKPVVEYLPIIMNPGLYL